jgi:hypothetical protein
MFWKNKKKKPSDTKDEIKDLYTSWKQLPGYGEPSVEELKVVAINFERYLKGYLLRHGVNVRNKSNKVLIELLVQYPFYPEHPELNDKWLSWVSEFEELRDYRNRVIHHRDLDTMPSVKELFERFKAANSVLREFSIVSDVDDRFEIHTWNDGLLQLKVDQQLLHLSVSDLSNLLCELETHSRGKVNFVKGKMVVTKFHDFKYEKLTVYIEDCDPFTLTIDEVMVFSDSLNSVLCQRLYP